MASDYQSRLVLLESMTPAQRQLLLQEEKLQEEESWLKFLIDSMKESDEHIEFFTRRAKDLYWGYETFEDETALDLAEQYVELAQNSKSSRYTLKDIREQRERVQCQRKIVNELKMLNEKPTEKLKS